jgi:hypothetical protein
VAVSQFHLFLKTQFAFARPHRSIRSNLP